MEESVPSCNAVFKPSTISDSVKPSSLLKSSSHEKITNCTITIKNTSNETAPGSEKYLVAYYEAEDEIPYNQLKEYLLLSLQDYMIPKYFIRIDSIPVTVNGKVDKKKLPDPLSKNIA